MKSTVNWKHILYNNLVFIILNIILFIFGLTGIFKRSSLYGGLDYLLPIILALLLFFFLFMGFYKNNTISSLSLVPKLKYFYLSYIAVYFFWGMLFWNEGQNTFLVYMSLLVIPGLNFMFSSIIEKFKVKNENK